MTDPSLDLLIKKLRLPSITASHPEVAVVAEKNGWSFSQYLYHLFEIEVNDRHRRRIERNPVVKLKPLASLNCI